MGIITNINNKVNNMNVICRHLHIYFYFCASTTNPYRDDEKITIIAIITVNHNLTTTNHFGICRFLPPGNPPCMRIGNVKTEVII